MFKENDYVVYRRNLCIVKGIKHSKVTEKDYYVLVPIDDESLTIDVPTENKHDSIRALISKTQVEQIIKEIPNVDAIEKNDRMIENEYKQLLNTGEHLALIQIIKTTYLRNKQREEAGKKRAEKDNNYFKLAEKILYNEFSVVLGMSYEDTKKYVVDKVTNLIK